MDYGKAIRILRAITGLQQRDLAQKARVDASLISLIEHGKRTPSLTTITRISAALEVPQHLFTLLASEGEDLRTTHPEEVTRAAEALAHMLIGNAARPKKAKKRGRKSAA